jgi:hypothetical protein
VSEDGHQSIESRLRALAEAGELSGFPGEGKPFAREDLEGDDARWAAFRLMKNNKVIPAWSQARIEIDAHVGRLKRSAAAHRTWLAARAADVLTRPADRMVEAVRVTEREAARFQVELEAGVNELNALIEGYNAIVPVDGLRLAPLSAAGLLASER